MSNPTAIDSAAKCPSCKSVATKIAGRSVEGQKYDEMICCPPDGHVERATMFNSTSRCGFRAFAVLENGVVVAPTSTLFGSRTSPGAEVVSATLKNIVAEMVLKRKALAEKERVARFCTTPRCRRQGKVTESQYCGDCNLETVSLKYKGVRMPSAPAAATEAGR